ncbi:MAG: hypothetical protein LBJ74_04280 [Heliobacteriaceae bacterium]|jgi:hypothetical protein|nr:hypothetical protein [Heliobacteriaceae bacterium]
MIITLPITIGKINDNGLRDVTVYDASQNEWKFETTQEKIDEFVSNKKEFSKEMNKSNLTNAAIGAAAGTAIIGITAAVCKAKVIFAPMLAGILGGFAAGFSARNTFCDKQDRAKYNKLVANLELNSPSE